VRWGGGEESEKEDEEEVGQHRSLEHSVVFGAPFNPAFFFSFFQRNIFKK
jgi:hypothetical protein